MRKRQMPMSLSLHRRISSLLLIRQDTELVRSRSFAKTGISNLENHQSSNPTLQLPFSYGVSLLACMRGWLADRFERGVKGHPFMIQWEKRGRIKPQIHAPILLMYLIFPQRGNKNIIPRDNKLNNSSPHYNKIQPPDVPTSWKGGVQVSQRARSLRQTLISQFHRF